VPRVGLLFFPLVNQPKSFNKADLRDFRLPGTQELHMISDIVRLI
jgi:hypothetical protein